MAEFRVVHHALSETRKRQLLEALAKGISIADAAALIRCRRRFVRKLLTEPEYQAAVRMEAKDIRSRQEPMNVAAAIAIRDDPTAKGIDRLKAIDVLEGRRRRGRPRKAVVPPTRDDPGTGGYIITKTADGGIAGAYITDGSKPSRIIPAAERDSNTGEFAADVEAERRETRTVRMTRE